MTTFDEYRAVGFTEAQAALLARDSASATALSQGMLDTLRAILAAVEGTNSRLDQTNSRLDQTNTRLDQLTERVGRIDEHLRTSPGRN